MGNNKIIVVGLGETAELAYEYFTKDSDKDVVAFAVDDEYISTNTLYGLPVVGLSQIQSRYPVDEYEAFVAVSSTNLNRIRMALYNRIKDMGYTMCSYVSSKAFVWTNVKIGENCFILEDNTLQPFTEVGNDVVMWSGNHLGHRSIIKDHCFVSSHCVISGYCVIGASSFLGVNCTIENNVALGQDSFVGAGALIRKNIEDNGFYQEGATERSKLPSKKIFKVK